jgi:polyhydroxybutyrate depolymerase
MKKIYILLISFLIAGSLQSQSIKTILSGGLTRKYMEYIPSTYTGASSVPVVFCLHGLGDNISNFKNIGMQVLGDTAGFITVYPEAVTSPYGTAWNSGASYSGYVLNGTVNDVGFLSELIDTIAAHYNVNMQRIYFCGFSMGGFMSNRMACQLGNRIAAIASAAGTIGTSLTCTPARRIPVCHFHGTSDGTVGYTGNSYGMDAEELVNYWVTQNNCDTQAVVHTSFPDIVNDTISVESFFYPSTDGKADVLFYKATGADHQWLYPPANDISYTIEIWKFFRKYTNITYSIDTYSNNAAVNIFPNPVNDKLTIDISEKSKIQIYTIQGQIIKEECTSESTYSTDVSNLTNGTYIVKITSESGVSVAKFVKQ